MGEGPSWRQCNRAASPQSFASTRGTASHNEAKQAFVSDLRAWLALRLALEAPSIEKNPPWLCGFTQTDRQTYRL
eukprot:394264-Pyramimonas_sp.AAC.2